MAGSGLAWGRDGIEALAGNSDLLILALALESFMTGFRQCKENIPLSLLPDRTHDRTALIWIINTSTWALVPPGEDSTVR